MIFSFHYIQLLLPAINYLLSIIMYYNLLYILGSYCVCDGFLDILVCF